MGASSARKDASDATDTAAGEAGEQVGNLLVVDGQVADEADQQQGQYPKHKQSGETKISSPVRLLSDVQCALNLQVRHTTSTELTEDLVNRDFAKINFWIVRPVHGITDWHQELLFFIDVVEFATLGAQA